MSGHSFLFRRVSVFSVVLLTAGAVLAVLGISDALLSWHSFSREVEQIYFALLWSILTLAFFSVTVTIVVGISEVVRLLRTPPGEGRKERSKTGDPLSDSV